MVSFFFLISLLHLFFKIQFLWQQNHCFFFFLCFCWDEHPITTIFTPATQWPVEFCDSHVGQCWDDTHKSRSVIKFVYLPTLTRLFPLVADASRRLGCFSSCLCHTPDVADRSELIVARNAQSLFVCLCTMHVSVSMLRPRSEFVPSCVCQILFCPQHVVLDTSISWQDRLWQSAAECDTHCELLDQWTNLTSQKVIMSQSSSAHVIIHIMNCKKIFKMVAEQELQSTECLGRKDRILAELIQLTCSCREEQLATVESSRHNNRQYQ